MLSTKAAFQKDMTQPTAPGFQHRHYAEIARIIRTLEPDIRASVASHFAMQLLRTNVNFNQDRFLRAVGGHRD